MHSLSDAIQKWNEGIAKKDDTFDVMAVVTSSCHSSEETSNKHSDGTFIGLADPQERARLRLSSIQSSALPTQGSVVCFQGVTIRRRYDVPGIELRHDNKRHQGLSWNVILPSNATPEQQRDNEQAAKLWMWWQQQQQQLSTNSLTVPRFVDRALSELALTAGLKGHVVVRICRIQRGHALHSFKRKSYKHKMEIQTSALLTDASNTTYVSLFDKTGYHFDKLEQAQRTQRSIRITFVKSSFTNGEEIVLLTTSNTRIIETLSETTDVSFSPDSPIVDLSPSISTRTVLSPLYKVNGYRILSHLPIGQDVQLEIEQEVVVAKYRTVYDVLSLGGDVGLLQALIHEAIPLRWTLSASAIVLRVSLVGFLIKVENENESHDNSTI